VRQTATDRICRGIIAGIAGGVAFAAVMQADIAISGRRVDDFKLLAGWGPLRDHEHIAGPAIHLINSASLGALYALVNERLVGPGWLRGLTFATAENLTLWPVIILLDRIHPAIGDGSLPEYNHAWPFIAESVRHLAFGLVLGALYERSGVRPSRMEMFRATF
jgi:hypothetical protein